MKKLIKRVLLTFVTILCFNNCTTVFAADAIVYGRLRTENDDKKAVYADILIDSHADLCVGAVLMSFSYDAAELRFTSAMLHGKSLNDKFEVYCDKNGTVNVLYGNKDGKSVSAESTLPFITLKFRKTGNSADTVIGIKCKSLVDGNAKELEISYIDMISHEMNAMLDDPTVTPEKLAGKRTAERGTDASSEESKHSSADNVNSEDIGTAHGDGENGQSYSYPLVINSESNTVRSMIIGGIIMLCVSALVFWGYKVGVDAVAGKDRKTSEPQDVRKNDKTEPPENSGDTDEKT